LQAAVNVEFLGLLEVISAFFYFLGTPLPMAVLQNLEIVCDGVLLTMQQKIFACEKLIAKHDLELFFLNWELRGIVTSQ